MVRRRRSMGARRRSRGRALRCPGGGGSVRGMSVHSVNRQVISNFVLSLDENGEALYPDQARAVWAIIREENESELHLVEQYAPKQAAKWRELRDSIDEGLAEAETSQDVARALSKVTSVMVGDRTAGEEAVEYSTSTAQMVHMDVSSPSAVGTMEGWG